jgi:hypothetical protein
MSIGFSAGSKVRFRSYERANQFEINLAEWIVDDVCPDRHNHDQIREACFSRQKLFPKEDGLQYVFIIPSSELDYKTLYIIHLEGPDNPAILCTELIEDCLLYIHSQWIIEGAKVLSTVIDGDWAGYVYNGQNYIINRPSIINQSNSALSTLIQRPVRTYSALKRIDFVRGHKDLRDFEHRALDVVKEANEGIFREDDYRALNVSAQYLSKSASSGNVDVIFKIQSTVSNDEQEHYTFHEIAVRQSNGSYKYGGFTIGIVGFYQQNLNISKKDYFNSYFGLLQEIGEEQVVNTVKYVFDGNQYIALGSNTATIKKESIKRALENTTI